MALSDDYPESFTRKTDYGSAVRIAPEYAKGAFSARDSTRYPIFIALSDTDDDAQTNLSIEEAQEIVTKLMEMIVYFDDVRKTL